MGILGHRQVGKTTFLQRVAREYVTLDDEDTLRQALASPKTFVAAMKANRSGIDECQLVPGVFPALKVRIGTTQIPGRFILTGSVRFTSRRAIRESLTGRISNLELHPFVVTEIQGQPNSSFLLDALRSPRIEGLMQVPLAIRTSQGVLGIIGIQSHSDINISLKRSAESFLKRYNHSKVVFVTREGTCSETINDRIGVFPAQTALF